MRLLALACLAASVIMAATCCCGGGGTGTPTQQTQAADDWWTRTNTPAWAYDLPAEVQEMWGKFLRDDRPLYTGIFCNGKSTKLLVNRGEWEKLTRFQAENHLMLAVLLPHTDETLVEFIDDQSKEVLAKFTPRQKGNEIAVVHHEPRAKSPDNPKPAKKLRSDFAVTVEEAFREWRADPAASVQRYRHAKIEVSGVTAAAAQVGPRIHLQLKSKAEDKDHVLCVFSDTKAVAKTKAGQALTVVGVWAENRPSVIVLKDCQIVPP